MLLLKSSRSTGSSASNDPGFGQFERVDAAVHRGIVVLTTSGNFYDLRLDVL